MVLVRLAESHHIRRAVVWTDFVQFILIVAAVAATITIGTYEIGGVSEVFAASSRGGRLIAFK